MGMIPCPYRIVIPEEERYMSITYPGVAPGRYSVSNNGKVVRFDGYVVSQFFIGEYLACNLMMADGTQRIFLVHRLVAWDWVYYNRDINRDVRHINGDRTNNHYTNLEWYIPNPTIAKSLVSSRCPYTIIVPMEEQFRLVTYPGVMPGRYSVSNNGKIVRFDGYVVSQFLNSGYLACNLMKIDHSQAMFFSHRIVAWEWVLENRDFNLTVNHIDGFKSNNQYTNLEWVSIEENLRHASRRGLIQNHFGEGTNHKLTEEDVHKVCQI